MDYEKIITDVLGFFESLIKEIQVFFDSIVKTWGFENPDNYPPERK